MKNLLFLLLLFCGLSGFSQADTIFVLGAEFGATTEPTDSTFTVDIIHPTDQLGQAFTAAKIQIGYRLIDVQGRLYRVKTVDATGIGSSTLTVVELQNGNAPSGTGLVYRKPDNSDCIPEIQTGDIGISYALAARVANHNAVNGCGGSGVVETIVAGTGISVDATDAANPIVTNTGIITEVDGDITNEGRLGVGAGISTSATITTNTSGSNPVSLEVGTGLSISEVAGTNGGIITLANTAPGSTEVSDGTTITGAGTVGSPFVANSDLINKQIGNYQMKADSFSLWPDVISRSGGGAGYIVINTGLKSVTPFSTIAMEFSVPIVANSPRGYTTIKVTCRRNGANTAYEFGDALISAREFTKTLTGVLGQNANGEILIAIGAATDAGLDRFVNFSKAYTSQNKGPLRFTPGNYSVTSSTNLTTSGFLNTSSMTVNNTAVFQGMTTESLNEGVATAATHYNNKNTSVNVTGVVTRYIPGNQSPSGIGENQILGAYFGAVETTGGGSVQAVIGTPTSKSVTATERIRITETGLVGIGTTTPGYLLSLGGTQAAARFTAHDVTLTGAEGLLYADLSEKTFKGHNGTSFFRFMQQSETVPTNGQVGVFNSTTLLYEPSNPQARSYTPTSTADTNGATGDIAYDDSYIYIKTSAGWKRSLLSTF